MCVDFLNYPRSNVTNPHIWELELFAIPRIEGSHVTTSHSCESIS
jgi:hypothetical protein